VAGSSLHFWNLRGRNLRGQVLQSNSKIVWILLAIGGAGRALFITCRRKKRPHLGLGGEAVRCSLRFLQCSDDVGHHLLSVTEEHQGIVRGEQRVGDPGEPRAQAPLDHHNSPRLVHIEDRHPGQGA